MRPLQIRRVDRTRAGDAFCADLAAARADGHNVPPFSFLLAPEPLVPPA